MLNVMHIFQHIPACIVLIVSFKNSLFWTPEDPDWTLATYYLRGGKKKKQGRYCSFEILKLVSL